MVEWMPVRNNTGKNSRVCGISLMKTNRSESVIQPKRADRDGFTLLELVVVLGVIAVLIVVELPVLAGAKSQTKIGVCASHLRQLALACQIYANENNNRLPVLAPPGSAAWAWDLPFNAAAALLKSGATTNFFYCPGTAPRFTDSENFEDKTPVYPPHNLWDFGNVSPPQNGFHVVGYVFAFSGMNSLVIVSNQNTTMLPEPPKMFSSGNSYYPDIPANADRVLVADATISSPNGGIYAQRYTYNYLYVQGGFYKPHVSPHLKGAFPAGGNLGFKDGHVAWRKFDNMDQRSSGNGQSFWW